MQGLTSYDDSDPESPPPTNPPVSKPSTTKIVSRKQEVQDEVDQRDSNLGLIATNSGSRRIAYPTEGDNEPNSPSIPPPQTIQTGTPIKKPLSIGIKKLNRSSSTPTTPAGSQARSFYGRTGTGSKSRFDAAEQGEGPGGVGLNSQPGELSNQTANLEDGLTEDELFRKLTAPRGWTSQGWAKVDLGPDTLKGGSATSTATADKGAEPWNIPELTSELPDPVLQNKVDTYLKLKLERDQHINTTLLSSTAFANPHIYSKLVEFVNIDERGTAFPNGGWLTRRGLEARRPVWGAKHLSDLQKREREAVERAQKEGGRKGIDFAPASTSSSRKGKEKERESDYPFVLPLDPAGRSNSGARRERREDDRDRDRNKERERKRKGVGEEEGRYERDRERKRERWKDGM